MRCWVISILTLPMLAPMAWAHALGATCRLHGNRVEVEAYYDDDTCACDAVVTVLSSRKEKITEGRTDDNGRWSFAAPPPGKYQVVIDAGAGHRVTRQLIVPGAGPSAQDAVLEPTREEFTRFPWLKLSLGVGTIALMCAAFLVAKRLQSENR
jgi:hypothetical protein